MGKKKPSKNKKISFEFVPGDFAVYPEKGVGRIEAIESRKIGGHTQDFYIMKILENGMVIMIPTKNVTSVGLRRVIHKNDVNKVYEIITSKKEGMIDNQTWNRRYREYMDKIKTGSLFDVAEVFRDLFMLKFTKELSFGEQKLLDTTQGLLLKELSTAENKDEKYAKIVSLLEMDYSPDSTHYEKKDTAIVKKDDQEITPFYEIDKKIEELYKKINKLITEGKSPQNSIVKELFIELRSLQNKSAEIITSALRNGLEEPIDSGRRAIKKSDELIEHYENITDKKSDELIEHYENITAPSSSSNDSCHSKS